MYSGASLIHTHTWDEKCPDFRGCKAKITFRAAKTSTYIHVHTSFYYCTGSNRLTEVDEEVSIEEELQLAGIAGRHQHHGGQESYHQPRDGPAQDTPNNPQYTH